MLSISQRATPERVSQSLQRDFRHKQADEFREDSQWVEDSQRQNPKFEAYYKKQGIIEEDEWEAFSSAARTELPVVFRISGRGPYAQELRHKLETDFFSKLANVKKEVSSRFPMFSPRSAFDRGVTQ